MSVVGFLVNIESILGLIPLLLHDYHFIMMYKFSQDHLELLSPSYNNPPMQLRSIHFRNCQPMHGCKLLSINSANRATANWGFVYVLINKSDYYSRVNDKEYIEIQTLMQVTIICSTWNLYVEFRWQCRSLYILM